jgi:thymidylate synthase (FAD)
MSTRYSIAIDASQATPPDGWRSQSESNRQGSEGMLDLRVGEELSAEESQLQARAREIYHKRLQLGVAREQARKELPLSTYTEAYWKIDLHNLLHFLELRMDRRAQQEIRAYAEAIGRQIVARLFPLVWEAFEDYRLQSYPLSRLERGVIARLAAAGTLPAAEEEFLAAQDPSWAALARCRERDECREKLVDLGLVRGK